MSDKYASRKYEVMAIRKGKEVVGYTFCRFSVKKLGEIFSHVRNIYPLPIQYYSATLAEYQQYQEAHDNKVSDSKTLKNLTDWWYERMGFQLRFVPNRKLGYTFKNGQFIRKK